MRYVLFQIQSEAIVNQIFPPEEEPIIDIDAVLDTVVMKVSQDLVNDIPAGDPRWSETRVPGKSSDYVM
jgi:nuclear pore complex protein Nup133